MEIKGQIIEIIFQNEINGYTVCEFLTEQKSITAVGYLPFINAGDTLKLVGKYVMHQEYGEQFKIETFEKVLPETEEGLINYLGSGLLKGIGPAIAKRIVDKFKDETLAVLKFEPSRLAEVKGITAIRAEEIAEEFNEKWNLWTIVQYLEKFGIGVNNAKRIYDELGENAVEEIEKNPYVLVDIVYGIDFKKIDKIALSIGIDVTFSQRIESGIKYALLVATINGHTCVLKENLIDYTTKLLEVDKENINNALINCVMKSEIVINEIDEQEWVFLYSLNKAEKNISEKIYNLQKSQNNKYIKNIDKEINIAEEKSEILFSEKQKEVIKLVNENNVCVITGGPGTGKTTIIKAIIDIYKNKNKKVMLCAPTGKAAKRMTETTGEEAKTIHRLLEIGKFKDDIIANVDEFITPIDTDILIIDEMSMVDIFLMNYVLKSIFRGTKLILVGDINQLESVGPGSILKNIIESECIPTIQLTTIFRQAAKSKIVINAHNVNNGKKFVKKEEISEETKQDFFYINENNPEKIKYELITLSKERLKKYGNYDFYENIQVISPTKKGSLGTRELNKVLQQALNPITQDKNERTYGEQIFREGDRVMQIKNNYEILWTKKGKYEEHGSGVFNGELGKIISIDEKEKKIQIVFDDEKECWYNFSELEQLELAYAITVHKAQGSEFNVVIIIIPAAAPMLLTRNLLYTGITRAKEMLVVIGAERVIEYMINNVNSKHRNTGLVDKLKIQFEKENNNEVV